MFHERALIAEMPKLRKFAMRLTRNASDADDLLQATLLRSLEKMEHFEEGTKLFSWTCKIMFNIFASEYRRKKKFETQYDPKFFIDRACIGSNQEACVDLVTVSESIEQLNPNHREIIVLVCVKEMSYEEAAEKLKMPVGTVRSRLNRARSHLTELMEPLPYPAHAAMLPRAAGSQGRIAG